MKHIKKKPLFEDRLKKTAFEAIPAFENYDFKDLSSDILKSRSKDSLMYISTTKNEVLQAFSYNFLGTQLLIPLADYTLVYYDTAYNQNIDREQVQKEVLRKFTADALYDEIALNLIYQFYGSSTSTIINLFNSIESFVNSLLPQDKSYVKVLRNKTELYSREQIQRQITLQDKLKEVLPQFYDGKNFFKKQTTANQHINHLKDLRDDIVHTKHDDIGILQIEIFKKLLKFNYKDTFISVRELFNFYKPNYIEDCPCSDPH